MALKHLPSPFTSSLPIRSLFNPSIIASSSRPLRQSRSPISPSGRRSYASTISDKPIIPPALAKGLGLGKDASGGLGGGAGGSQTARAEVQLRRFWKTVGIMEQSDGSYHITLDARPLRTPSGTRLSIPHERKILAMLVANEWENQGSVLKVVGLPMTSLASRAMDGLSDEATRKGVIDELFRYLDTDTTCFPADYPSTLIRLQKTHWTPLHAWYKSTHNISITSYDTLVLGGGERFKQSEETKRALRELVGGWDEWQIAGLERATYATKSFLIAFALVSGRLSADQAAQASHVEVNSQIELWGEVEDTHDVDFQDIRRQLGSVKCLLAKA